MNYSDNKCYECRQFKAKPNFLGGVVKNNVGVQWNPWCKEANENIWSLDKCPRGDK